MLELLRQKKYSSALDGVRQALQAGQRTRQIYSIQASALYALGRFGEARAAIEMALQISPDNEQLLAARARIIKKMEEA